MAGVGTARLAAAASAGAARRLRSICGYCSTGCALELPASGEDLVLPASDYPVNSGFACPKGWEALRVLRAADRATDPLRRTRDGQFEIVDWDAALELFVERIRSIQRHHGPASVAFLSSGQIATEEMALLGAVAKFGMGLVHGDGNTRQCMASAVVAYKESFGFDAPPYTYADFELSDVIVLIGSNLCIAHPILWQRIWRNRRRPTLIVIDPRRTETAMQAHVHLPIKPKSDLALFYGLANWLIEHGRIDREFVGRHTNGFEAFAAFVRNFDLKTVAQITGVPPEAIEDVARRIGPDRRVSFWWTMGVNQSHQGVRTAQAIINLALLTGNIGKPGTGANSITGQCNAMGSRLFSNTTNLLGGHDFANPSHRRKVARRLGIDARRIPGQPGWSYDRILKGILQGEIRGLWVVATNPAHSWINQSQFHDIVSRLDFLVVQDMYHSTETARLADLVLPAAGWGEKEGTFINSERRIARIRQVCAPPGNAMADFEIFRRVAERWGCGAMFAEWTSPEAVFRILCDLTGGQPCDISGITGYAMLDAAGGIQWPFPAKAVSAEAPATRAAAAAGRQTAAQPRPSAAAPWPVAAAGETADERRCDSVPQPQQRRLFQDGRFFHADGRARFVFEPPRSAPEQPTARFPLILLTGRGTSAQWHTQTRTAKSPVLARLAPSQPYVEIHPEDAAERGIGNGDRVRVSSPRGQVVATALLTPTVPPGCVFLPMHYATTNRLTDAVFDPYSRQPAYKACAAQVAPLAAAGCRFPSS